MKKLISILLCTVLAVGSVAMFAGCDKETNEQETDYDITLQLKWLPQAQFMGYYVADALGYYEKEGIKVNIVPGGGDLTAESAVVTGAADIGVTWVSSLISSIAQGNELVEIAQIYQSSGLLLISRDSLGVTDLTTLKTAVDGGAKVGNWGYGNQYEVQALLQKAGLPTTYDQQNFTMDEFAAKTIDVASAMTYNEYGLIINGYDGTYSDTSVTPSGDFTSENINVLDMNSNGVAMLEDCLFVSADWLKVTGNSAKLVKFIKASILGWELAVNYPEAAAYVVYKAGSSVSMDHQYYMASEVAKLVKKGMDGQLSSNYIGYMDEAAMTQTLSLTKEYAGLTDTTAAEVLAGLSISDIYDSTYWASAIAELYPKD